MAHEASIRRESQDKLLSREELVQELRHDLSSIYPKDLSDKAWNKTADYVRIYSKEMVDRWNGEIDGLLTYAGLFSSVLSAFIVQSYQLMQPSPADETNAILAQISSQLQGATVFSTPPSINYTRSSLAAVPPAAFQAPVYAVWLNVLWFASLICSLTSASVGIMVKQWLNRFNAGLTGTSREAARLRQWRLNNVLKWRVAEIVAMLPVLIQVATVLFLTGLLILLWNIHLTVAAVSAVLVGILFAFMLATTTLPAVFFDCAYLSPPAFAAYDLLEKMTWICYHAILRVTLKMDSVLLPLYQRTSPIHHRSQATVRSRAALLLHKLINAPLWAAVRTHRRLFHERDPYTWYERERMIVREKASGLDGDSIRLAYTSSLDPAWLDVAETCLADCPHSEAVKYHHGVTAALTQHSPWRRREAWPIYAQLATRIMEGYLLETPARVLHEADHLLLKRMFERLQRYSASSWLDRLVRSLAILSMGRDETARGAFTLARTCLETSRPEATPNYSTTTLRAVAAAARFRVATYTQASIAAGRDIHTVASEYLQGVVLASRCMAKNAFEPSSTDFAVIWTCTRDILAECARLLRSPVMGTLCHNYSDLFDVLKAIAAMRDQNQHSHNLVTESLLDDLESVLFEEPPVTGNSQRPRLRQQNGVRECWETIDRLRTESGLPSSPVQI